MITRLCSSNKVSSRISLQSHSTKQKSFFLVKEVGPRWLNNKSEEAEETRRSRRQQITGTNYVNGGLAICRRHRCVLKQWRSTQQMHAVSWRENWRQEIILTRALRCLPGHKSHSRWTADAAASPAQVASAAERKRCWCAAVCVSPRVMIEVCTQAWHCGNAYLVSGGNLAGSNNLVTMTDIGLSRLTPMFWGGSLPSWQILMGVVIQLTHRIHKQTLNTRRYSLVFSCSFI